MGGRIANKPACDVLKAGIAAKRLKKVSYGGMSHCVDTRGAGVSISFYVKTADSPLSISRIVIGVNGEKTQKFSVAVS
jgi:hypothetical protein